MSKNIFKFMLFLIILTGSIILSQGELKASAGSCSGEYQLECVYQGLGKYLCCTVCQEEEDIGMCYEVA